MSHSNIEMYNNTIKGHKTLGIAINSWLFTGLPYKSEEFDPFATNIHIHDNVIEGAEGSTDVTTDFGKLITQVLDNTAYDIIIDGIFKPGSAQENGAPSSYCFSNNGDISFVNLNAAMGKGMEDIGKYIDHDLARFDCTLPVFDTASHDDWLASN